MKSFALAGMKLSKWDGNSLFILVLETWSINLYIDILDEWWGQGLSLRLGCEQKAQNMGPKRVFSALTLPGNLASCQVSPHRNYDLQSS